MIDKKHKFKKLSIVYGSYEYDIAITSKYSMIVSEFIRQHIYTTKPYSNKSNIKFYQNFYNIIDSNIYENLYQKIKANQTHDFFGFKTDVYSVATIGDTIYYLCERDHSIVYKRDSSTYVIVDEKYDFEYQLLRILREYIYRSEEDNGKVFMHAAACAIEEQGFLILGDKGAGKTTLLNYLLESKVDFLANDRVFLQSFDSEINIEGFPIPMRISYETINKMSHRININSLYRKQSKTSDKALITPWEIGKIYNTNIRNKVKLSAVFIPQICIQDDVINIQNIDYEAHQKVLLDNCFTPEDESRKNEWICQCKKTKVDLEINACKMLKKLSAYPTYRITYGTECQPTKIVDCIKGVL